MTTETQTSAPVLPAALRMGAVELTVTDLDRSVHFYETAIGLRLHGREGDRAALGAGGEDLLVLVEDPDARRAGRHSGLYHFALLHALAARARPRRRRASRSPARASAAPPTTASPRRSTCPTPTTTGSSSPPTAAASTGATCATRPRSAAPSRSTSPA